MDDHKETKNLTVDQNNSTLYDIEKIESLRMILASMKKDQAYLGLADILDWVLEKSSDETNTFNDACNFVQRIVANNLYTEGYCAGPSVL